MKENLFTHDNFSRQRAENINTLKIVIFLYINAFVRLDVSVFDNLIKTFDDPNYFTSLYLPRSSYKTHVYTMQHIAVWEGAAGHEVH